MAKGELYINTKDNINILRKRNKSLGVPELIAIALGGMIGGGIFSILGISVSMIGVFTPIAILLGGIIAVFAAYSYIKLGVYYKDEGASYSFYKKTFPKSPFAASMIGWWVIFGYISTLALYAYTFASYAISGFVFAEDEWVRKVVAGGVIAIFTIINLWSVKGMGKIEDVMVYTKLVILAIISFLLIYNRNTSIPVLLQTNINTTFFAVLTVSSITFVAYEGFQLVTNAVNEMTNPEKNIPRAIYSAIVLAVAIYIIISLGAILAIPFHDIILNKEYALASGTQKILGDWGTNLVILGALLATSSAISGTVFGASRQMTVIAEDGYFPKFLAKRVNRIPGASIVAMSSLAFCLVLVGDLEIILEFGSVTFLIVSLMMAYANYRIRVKTKSSAILTIIALFVLSASAALIIYFEVTTQITQVIFIVGLYALLTLGAWLFSRSIKQTT